MPSPPLHPQAEVYLSGTSGIAGIKSSTESTGTENMSECLCGQLSRVKTTAYCLCLIQRLSEHKLIDLFQQISVDEKPL